MSSARRNQTKRSLEPFSALSVGGAVVLMLAVLSGAVLALRPVERRDSTQFWTFTRMHAAIYEPAIERWNAERPGQKLEMTVFSIPALERRTMSSFLARTAMAELLEVDRTIAQRTFGGPLEDIGFVDLTDRLAAEGLLDAINPPSFSAWTSRGRIFGIPHDVHPVMLAYRADLVEAAGIDLSHVETWDDFFAAMRPLMTDADGDGEPDRYLLNFWETHVESIETLLLQAGGGFFDAQGRPIIASDANARALAKLASWIGGPTRVAGDAPDFTASGNALKLNGYVASCLMPDWMCDIFQKEIPQLSGKLKLMPLPAFERGGRRTSVWGGSMLGISRTAADVEQCWQAAKHLYLSPELARQLYEDGDIISPVRSNWSDPIYDSPDPYFCGQAKGRMYIELADDIPPRPSSPFTLLARARVQEALMATAQRARVEPAPSIAELEAEARSRLAAADRAVRAAMARNRFHAQVLETSP
ncbi:MAG: extracellular solute-binding protein [Planctomycetota bacterium]|nr:extracellular solute-binding protein [Planctomycetota bacterium]